MSELNGPAALIIILLGVGYWIAPPIYHVVKKVPHAIVHVLTLGHK